MWISTLRPVFDHRPVHVRFERNKVALKQPPPSTAPHLPSPLILLLSEGQAAETSEASNKAVIFQISGSVGQTERTLTLLCFRPASDELD